MGKQWKQWLILFFWSPKSLQMVIAEEIKRHLLLGRKVMTNLDSILGLPLWLRWESVCLQCRRHGFNPWVGKIPRRREWKPTPVFLPGQINLVDLGSMGSQRVRTV